MGFKTILCLFAALLLSAYASPHNLFFTIIVSISFPALQQQEYQQDENVLTNIKKQAILLITLLALIELLHLEHAQKLQIAACIVASNASLFFSSPPPTKPIKPICAAPAPPLPTPPPMQSSPPALQPTPQPAARPSATTTPPRAYAAKGNGQGEEVSPEQLAMIQGVHERLLQNPLFQLHPELNSYFTLETCRRYLVARQWNEKKAMKQLVDSVEWNSKQETWKLKLEESPACVNDPYALSLRVVGLDHMNRPVIMAEFRHALHRTNAAHNITHFERVVEGARALVAKLFQTGVTSNASQLQWVLVVFFPGFGLQDMSLRTASECVKLLTHFPEFLGNAILVDAPLLFSSAWSTINALLDDRVRQKVSFLSLNKFPTEMLPVLGEDMTRWLEIEMKSLQAHDTKRQGKRAYWNVPAVAGEHDSRGEARYVNNPDWYIRTPGDAWRERGAM